MLCRVAVASYGTGQRISKWKYTENKLYIHTYIHIYVHIFPQIRIQHYRQIHLYSQFKLMFVHMFQISLSLSLYVENGIHIYCTLKKKPNNNNKEKMNFIWECATMSGTCERPTVRKQDQPCICMLCIFAHGICPHTHKNTHKHTRTSTSTSTHIDFSKAQCFLLNWSTYLYVCIHLWMYFYMYVRESHDNSAHTHTHTHTYLFHTCEWSIL